jgi:hypothetical protein
MTDDGPALDGRAAGFRFTRLFCARRACSRASVGARENTRHHPLARYVDDVSIVRIARL